MAIPTGEPFIDRRFQLVRAAESTAADHPSRNEGKKPFDLIQPGATGRGEVEMEPFSLLRLQPFLHFSALVGAVVVHDQMHVLIGRELGFEIVEKPDEFAAPMTVLAGANDLAVQDVKSREQCRGAMPLIVVGLTFWQAGPQGEGWERFGREPESGSSRPRTIPALFPADSGTVPQCPAPSLQSADRWIV